MSVCEFFRVCVCVCMCIYVCLCVVWVCVYLYVYLSLFVCSLVFLSDRFFVFLCVYFCKCRGKSVCLRGFFGCPCFVSPDVFLYVYIST